ncbi:Branchpoint-bridging protein [Pichia kudriavzevii]|uniref:Branchpoint-bridging protein n=1 Tax=Pichia kudriavzevii TaxID=4909 RepID=A0A1V2LHX3_PICKU|nr:Branchpoint-bridging protein [Pichia kudriavzevii]
MAMEETKLDLDVDFGDRGRTRERLFSSHHWTGKPSKGVAIRQHNKPTPTIISNTLTSEQIEAYATLVRIDEIGHMIATGVPVPVPTDGRSRSPSPEPIYDSNGLRKNTREQRMRQKLDRERNFLVERMFQLVEDYKAPDWYKPKPTKIVEKLYIKADEYPEINFVGLLLGPRGNTLNKLQKDSGAVIGIRGKGSVKQVNRGPSNIDMSHLQEKLHCLITADSQEKVDLAKKLCQEVMDKAIFSPVGQNDLKRDQLRELAKLNGTYRETSERMCPVCGNSGHGRNTCPQKPSFSSTLRCGKCGNIGHLEKDCISEGKEGDEMDQEFEEFMNDLNGNNEDPGVHQTSGNADRNHDYSERHRGNNSYQPVQQLHGSQQLLPQPYTKPPVYPPSLKTTNRVPLPSTKAVDTTTRSHGVSVPTPPPPPPPPQAPQAPQSVPPQALPPPPPPPPPAKKAPGKKTTHPAQHLPPPPPPPPFRGKS